MAEWTLQHGSEIQDGYEYPVKAAHLVDNYNALKSDIDDRLSITTASSQTVTGAVTMSAQSTFNNGLKTDTITEESTNAGVTIEGIKFENTGVAFPDAGELTISSGAITVTGTYHTVDTESDAASDDLDTINGNEDGFVVVLQTENDSRDVTIKHGTGNINLSDGADFTLSTTDYSITLIYSSALSAWVELSRAPSVSTAYPTEYMQGPPPAYVSATQWKIPSGFRCRDGADSYNIIFASDATAAITSSGANGLDTGAEANSTWYYLWAIGDTSGANSPAALLSVSSSSPTMPSGYDVKRLLPVVIRNNASGNFMNMDCIGGWPHLPEWHYRDVKRPGAATAATGLATVVLDAGTATTFTNVDCSALIPPLSKIGNFWVTGDYGGAAGELCIRPDGDTTDNFCMDLTSGDNVLGMGQIRMPTSGSQVIEYKVAHVSTECDIVINGYVVTEVN